MTHLLVLIGTGVGWAMIGHVAARYTLSLRRRHRTPKLDPETARLARIARLEIACGVGLKYGAEALQGVGTRLVDPRRVRSEHDLRSFGGIVERFCWACDEQYKPSDHDDWWRPRDPSKSWSSWSMYDDNSNPDRDPLDETLCPSCLAKARAELDYGVPL